MGNKRKAIIGLASILFLFSALTTFALDFSGDMVHKDKTSGVRTAKIYVSNDKSRIEFPEGISITRMDKKVMWMLMPEQKMYMEMPMDPSSATFTEKLPGEIERILVGQDVIDGRVAKKYKIVYTVGGVTTTVFQWIDNVLNMPVKTEAEDGSWSVEYKNIQMGSQPASLFEIPAGYKKTSEPTMDIDIGGGDY